MKKFKNIHRLVLCLSIFAIAFSVPASSPAAASKNASSKNNSSNAKNSNGASSNAATTAAATYNTSTIVIPANDGIWHTVLTTTIKNPTADDDLFINVSQVTKITTATVTSSSTPSVISSGNAKLQMRVLVDGVAAQPGPIVFDEQLTTLTSSLQSFLSLSCTATPTPQTIITTSCVCNSTTVTPAAISCDATLPLPTGYTTRTCTSQTTTDTDVVTTCNLVNGANQSLGASLEQTLGHSFDFLAPGIGGMGNTHTIQVQVTLTQATTNGGTVGQALIGPGTLNVNAVNLK